MTMTRPDRSARRTAWVIALPTLVVIAVVLSALAHPGDGVIPHLARYVLPEILPNTLLLVVLVATGATALGTALAWLTAVYEFPGRRVFSWALLLPMALPGYVLAFVLVGLADYAGPLQTALREQFGWRGELEAVRGLPGLVFVLCLALYPYVYLLARGAFLTQGRRALEVAQISGLSPARGFFRVALPMARPWIAAGALLVVMETLADFGTVSVFNYDTFTTAIYESWFSLFSISSALKLASVLLLLVFIVVLIERRYARAARYRGTEGGAQRRKALEGAGRWGATAFASAVLLFGLLIPVAQLLAWAFGPAVDEWGTRFFLLAARTVGVALAAALMLTILAVALGAAARRCTSLDVRLATRVATLGYALPGAVLAVGVFVPIAALGNGLDSLAEALGATTNIAAFLQGSLLTMFIAYAIRFLAVSFSPVENGLMRVTPSIDESARLLGVHGRALVTRVYTPMMRASLLTAMLLAFVDVLKEMPITLMTRPFGWDTLAVRIFEKTAEGQWPEAAPAALAIVAAGLLPVAIMTRSSERALAV